MSKVTSKLQVTLPKALAEQYGIRPGDEIEWQAAGDIIRIIPPRARRRPLSTAEALAMLRASVQRQKDREAGRKYEQVTDRGWTREELYDEE